MERLTQVSTDVSPSLPRVSLILGGARSGKSAYAERLIVAAAGGGVYVATAQARDDEMRARIAQHRRRRGEGWHTIESPRDILGPLQSQARPVLVDCLTLWLSNLFEAGSDVSRACDELDACLAQTVGPVVLVANEVGLGIVPDNALARAFRDAAGRVNQRVAERADQVVFVAAGLPLKLK